MSVTFELFKAVKDIIDNDEYLISFNDINTKKEKVVGLYIKSGSTYDRSMLNNILQYSARLVFNVQAENSRLGIIQGTEYCEMLIEKLTASVRNGCRVYKGDNINIYIYDIKLIEGVNTLGKNEMNIPIFSVNFIIKYGFEEVK